jgi:hypothetical protein
MRRDEKLRRKVPLLGKLGVIKRLLQALEIGAAVLPIGVEEQRVKSAIEIVVVSLYDWAGREQHSGFPAQDFPGSAKSGFRMGPSKIKLHLLKLRPAARR